MHIKANRLYALFLTLLTVLSLAALPAQAASGDPVPITVLATGNIRGQLSPLDYITQEEDRTVGLSLIAGQVAAIRKAERNVLLVDAGNTVLGAAMGSYAAFGKKTEDPAIKVMRLMDYDMWTLGSREFGGGLNALRRQINYLTRKDKGTEKAVPMCTANIVAEDQEWDPWMGSAYVIREIRTSTAVVKVGLIGLDTPAIPQREAESNLRGMEFRDFAPTIAHYVPLLRKQEGCDIVIAVCHSGVEETSSEDGAHPADPENQIRCMIEHTTGIDAVISGGEGSTDYREDILNAEGKAVPVISAGSGSGLAYLKLLYDPLKKAVTPASEENGFRFLADEEALKEDSRVSAALAPYNEELQTWLDKSIATATEEFTNENISLRPTAVMDLFHRAQLSAVPADLSICAPVTNGGEARTLLKKGKVTMRELWQLCPADDCLCRVRMTGEQLRLWLELAATKYQGLYSDYFGGGFYTDEVYGLSYEIHHYAPEGSRIEKMTYKGRAVTPEQTFTVVVSGARLSNVGGFMEAAGLDWTDESLSDFCTLEQLGGEAGLTRNILAEYIRGQGQLTPSVQSTWKLIRTARNS